MAPSTDPSPDCRPRSVMRPQSADSGTPGAARQPDGALPPRATDSLTWQSMRAMVLERDAGRCVACGDLCPRGEADVHHLMPRWMGGEDVASNLVTLCDGCHAAHHPTLQVSLARRMMERWALRLARWLDRRGPMPAELGQLGAVLRLFGKTGFRAGQLQVVTAALEGRSVLLVSPTGSGKSLCYQLPALLRQAPTLVLSPLKALMADQVVQLTRQKIPASFINSALGTKERELRMTLLEAGALKLFYCAPERFDPALVGEAGVERLARLRPAFLVVDEAHCIDRWGDDFRPSYGRIAEIREALGNPTVLAFTATAGLETQRRILASLNAPDADVVVTDVDRPNIALLRVPHLSETVKVEIIRDLLGLGHGGRTMIFVPTKKAGNALHVALQAAGHVVPFFHSGLDEITKEFLQGRYSGRLLPQLPAIICTNAFGMGLDLPDVRLVIHWQTPASVEDYVQEIGRAGRDGRQSVAVLLSGQKDGGVHHFMLERTIEAAVTRLAASQRTTGAPPVQTSREAERLAHLAKHKGQQINTVLRMATETSRCFRRDLNSHFVAESTTPTARPRFYVRVLAWLFGSRRRALAHGACCDFCTRLGTAKADEVVRGRRTLRESLGAPDMVVLCRQLLGPDTPRSGRRT